MVPGVSQFIELIRFDATEEVSLNGYSIVLAETTNSKKLRGNILIRCALELDGTKMASQQQYAVLGRSMNDMEANDILEFKYSRTQHMTKQTYNSNNWLAIEEDLIMLVFLMYSKDFRLLGLPDWQNINGFHRTLKGEPLTYIKSHLIDFLLVSGVSAPDGRCEEIQNIFFDVVDFEGVFAAGDPSDTDKPSLSSISRCGAILEKFMLHTYKSTLPTPGILAQWRN